MANVYLGRRMVVVMLLLTILRQQSLISPLGERLHYRKWSKVALSVIRRCGSESSLWPSEPRHGILATSCTLQNFAKMSSYFKLRSNDMLASKYSGSGDIHGYQVSRLRPKLRIVMESGKKSYKSECMIRYNWRRLLLRPKFYTRYIEPCPENTGT